MKNKSKTNKNRRQGRKNRSSLPARGDEYRAPTDENRAALRITKAFKGPNHKYINSVYNAMSGFVSITAPFVQLLNGVAQGTSENTRIGRLTKNHWLDIDFSVNVGAAAVTDVVRFYIVVETTALGSALAPAQFFVDATNFSPYSQRDRTNRNASRYCVLYDSKPFVLGGLSVASGQTAPVVTGAGQPAERTFSMHLPLNFSTDYSRGNAGTVADIDTNSLYLLVVTDTSTGSQVGIGGGFTLCFADDQ